MTDHPLYPLACRLRPELSKLTGDAVLQAFVEVLGVMYLMPFAIAGGIWLILVSSTVSFLTNNPFLMALIATGLLITNHQIITVYIALGSKGKLTLTSSLGTILFWTGIFIWGPLMIWISLIIDLISNLHGAWRLKRLNQNVFWGPLANYLQSLIPILGYLLGLKVYTTLGGSFPLSDLNITNWVGPMTAILIASVLSGVILLPIYYMINVITGSGNSLTGYGNFLLSAVGLAFIPAPFGIPIALLFVKAGMLPFAAMVIGVILVNLLAHHLSRTNQRNLQQSLEMKQLEQLGEEILQSQPDGSNLTGIFQKRLASMFSNPLDIVAVRIFDNSDLPGYSDRYAPPYILHPDASLAPDKSIWEQLHKTDDDYLVLKDQVPNGFNSIYGDAVLAKINSAAQLAEGEKPNCIGGVYLLRNKTVARTVDSLESVQALASQIGSALYRVQVHQETLVSEKMTQELEFAGKIQATFLPESVPQLDGWGLAASLIPARQTSGDFYDFIMLDGNKIGLLIADVADKGTGAALYMALSRTLLRTFAQQFPDSPEDVFRLANDRIFEDSRADQFVTAFYGVLDLESGQFIYANAGHNPTFLLRAENGQPPEALKRTGVALGAMEDLTWKSTSIQLNKGDLLLFYTDGVVEAQNENDEFFNEEQLLRSAKTNMASTADMIHNQIMEDLHSFIGKAAQFDDITMLTLKRE